MNLSHVLVYSDEAAYYEMVSALLPSDCLASEVHSIPEVHDILRRETISLIILALDRTDNIPQLIDLSPHIDAIPVMLIYPADMKPDTTDLSAALKPVASLNYPLQPMFFRATIRRALRQQPQTSADWDREQALRKVNERLNERLQELNTIYTVGKTVALSLDTEEALARALTASVNLTQAEDGFIVLCDGDDLYLRVSASHDQTEPSFTRRRVSDQMVEQVIKSGRPAMLHRETKLSDGVLVRALLYVPLHVPGRGVIGVLGVVNRTHDVQFTEHQLFALSSVADFSAIAIENAQLYTQVETERSRLSAILENTREPIIVTDENQNLWLWSQSAARSFDIPDEAQGQALDQVINNPVLLDMFTAESPPVAPIEVSTPNGRIYSAQLSTVPGSGSIAVLQDITDLKELDRLKTEFVFTVSHDLRSPLTTIQGYLSILDRAGPLTNMQRDFIKTALISLDHITALITDLLDIGRIEAGYDLDMIAEDMSGIIQKAIHHSQILAENANIELVWEKPDKELLVWGNAKRLGQVMENLLSNAIKYNQAGGWVHVKAKTSDDFIEIAVEDNGIGIPEEEIPHIWERFYRVQSPKLENVQGTGLGLSIVESVIHKHNGRIWVNSTPGKGSTFTFILPRSTPQSAAS